MEKVIMHTDGGGWWSRRVAAVHITDIQPQRGFIYHEEDEIRGELRVYFNTKTWKVEKDGLIYTDRKLIKELRQFLESHGLPGDDVGYSEQGMQGCNYVSLDAGEKFYSAWMRKFKLKEEDIVTHVSLVEENDVLSDPPDLGVDIMGLGGDGRPV